MSGSYVVKAIQILFAAYLLLQSYHLYMGDQTWLFIQNVNLIFHEAGHVLFRVGGSFLYVLGGTLGEIGIPLIVTVYFFLQQSMYSTGFGLWWLSTALYSVGIYAADARLQQLPLLSGDTASHDWTYLLSTLGILEYDHVVATVLYLCSFLACTSALLAWTYAYREVRQRT